MAAMRMLVGGQEIDLSAPGVPILHALVVHKRAFHLRGAGLTAFIPWQHLPIYIRHGYVFVGWDPQDEARLKMWLEAH